MPTLYATLVGFVLGGGDGMAAREILKYPSVKSITLVDLDPALTDMFRDQELFARLNDNSLKNEKVKVINKDAFVWLRKCKQKYDVVVVDFPDPNNFSLGKLYSDTFYRALKRVVKPETLVVIQSTSPYFAKNSFWCVVNTLNSVGFKTKPYHAYVPSFGDWGYIVASMQPCQFKHNYPDGLRYVASDTVNPMLSFSKDMMPTVSKINRLNNQTLVHLFESEWSAYAETY